MDMEFGIDFGVGSLACVMFYEAIETGEWLCVYDWDNFFQWMYQYNTTIKTITMNQLSSSL
jgi:hypothetical protein